MAGVGFPGDSVVKNLPAYRCSVPGLGRSPGEEKGNSLQHSCLDNPMDREAWQVTVLGVAKSTTWLTMHVCIAGI